MQLDDATEVSLSENVLSWEQASVQHAPPEQLLPACMLARTYLYRHFLLEHADSCWHDLLAIHDCRGAIHAGFSS